MTLHRAHPRQQGFSMLEVLIAILVFSLGIVGIAGLLIFSIQSNHVAYLRTQATFLAHNMADRMGANPAGLWANAYNGAYPLSAASTSAAPDCSAGCTPADLATYDKAQWSTQLRSFLPNVSGNITCVTTNITYTPNPTQVDMRPPYGGTCTMALAWNEAGGAGGAQQTSLDSSKQGQQPHSFMWIFQP